MKLSVLMSLLLSLSACKITPPDIFVFEFLGQRKSVDVLTGDTLLIPSPTCMAQIKENECLHGTSIMTGTQVYVGQKTLFKGKTMTQLQQESILLPAIESYAPLETYIINSCKKMNCSDSVDKFKVKLNSLNGIKGVLSNN